MRDFTCFGENGVQISDSSAAAAAAARTAQNLVTCTYRCRLQDRPCLVTVSWAKYLMGQGVSVGIDGDANRCACKVDIKPWSFSRRKGCRSTEAGANARIDVFWDLSGARFGSSPEPLEEFYLAVVLNGQDVVLLLGDLKEEAWKKINGGAPAAAPDAVCVAKREHVFGRKRFASRARFREEGRSHEVAIECEGTEARLVIRIDGRAAVQVKRLRWKFRGNQTIFVDGLPVEVFWDVHGWLFGGGSAVFMFQACPLPATEKGGAPAGGDPCAVTWTCLQSLKDPQWQGPGFSLILYAWRSE